MRATATLTAFCLLAWASSASGQALTPTPVPTLTPTAPPVAPAPVQPPVVPATPPAATSPAAPVTTLSTFKVGNWTVGAYTAPGSTGLGYCAGVVPYKNGITLAFAVSNAFQWSMALYDPAWKLTAGMTYQVAYAIDSAAANLASATALNANAVDVPLAPNIPLFKQFMEGEQLKVQAAAATFVFDLTDTIQMLPALLRCVEAYVGTAPPSANPFVASSH